MKILISTLIILGASSAFADVYSFAERDIHVSTEFQGQEYLLALRDDASGRELKFEPNLGALIIPKISYQNLWALSWAFKTPIGETEKILEGETRYTDIRFDFSFHDFTVNTYYSQYQGFYIANSDTVNSNLTDSDPRIQRPDLYSRNYGVSFTWVWD
ncbi:MAG: hypothetical protein AAF203_05770, partial [Pseudomonadota bacterium]